MNARRTVLGALAAFTLLGPVRWHVVTLVRVLAARMAYPMDLEWMDGGALYHAYRWLHGLPLYTSPDRWVPYPYPPVHYAALALLGRIFGLDYPVGRCLALAGIVVCLALLSLELLRANVGKALAAAGIALSIAAIGASFPLLGGTLDNTRPDTLALAFAVVAAFLLPEGNLGWARATAVALALSLSVYSKQTAVFFVAWILVFVTLRDRRSGFRLAISTLVISGASLAVLQASTDGWFMTWLLNTRHHEMKLSQLEGMKELGAFLPLLAPLLAFVRGERRPRAWLWIGMLGASLVAGVLAFLKTGGWLNNLIAPVVLLGPVTWLVATREPGRRWGVQAATIALTAGVLWRLEYDPSRLSPTSEQLDQARQANELVRGLDGCVAVPTYPFLPIRNGHPCPEVSSQANHDAELAGMTVDLGRALANTGARWVVLTGAYGEAVPPGYVFDREVPLVIGDLRYYEAPDWPRKTGVWRRIE
jgi:hypothetical protein